MSDSGKPLNEEHEPSFIVRFFKTMIMTITNPRKGFLQLKDSPNLLAIIVIPLILAGLTFIQYYILYMIKMSIPSRFYTDQISSFLWGWIWYLLIQYVFLLMFSIILASIFFSLGKWAGGYGGLKHSICVSSHAHIPNILGLLTAIFLILLVFPTVKTGIVNYVGYTRTGQPEDNIVLELNNYTGVDSNLTISVSAYYSIPLNATTSYNGAIMDTTEIIDGKIKTTYVERALNGVNATTQIVLLNGTKFGYNIPIKIGNVFNGKVFKFNNTIRVDLTLFLNNTYILPMQENVSVPYIITLKVFDSEREVKTYDIAASFSTNIFQSPDPRPFFNVLEQRINPVMQALSVIISIWQFGLMIIAFQIIHEIKISRAIIFVAVYAIAKYFLIGFII
ncbi:MAG: YIP1 family protein [Candidatus Brockarchaeota archaeon]|nr:YIP1 family protein [Candidatus Brockarchaeota archaeon]